jgi:hypothetical protein
MTGRNTKPRQFITIRNEDGDKNNNNNNKNKSYQLEVIIIITKSSYV